MKYIVTRDLIDDNHDGAIVLWPEDTPLTRDEDGYWGSDNMQAYLEEMEVKVFKERYNLYIAPGEKKLINIVVSWLDEGEDND